MNIFVVKYGCEDDHRDTPWFDHLTSTPDIFRFLETAKKFIEEKRDIVRKEEIEEGEEGEEWKWIEHPDEGMWYFTPDTPGQAPYQTWIVLRAHFNQERES